MLRPILFLALMLPLPLAAQEEHHHPPPEKLGSVSFPISCNSELQGEFNRDVALLHSFAYQAARDGFQKVARKDPQCAIAHWGVAMTHYHQLWDLPPSPADAAAAAQELQEAQKLQASPRERGFIQALALVLGQSGVPVYRARALHYEDAMRELAAAYPNDTEVQVFYALALVSNASPTDTQHRRQKQAADLLQPLFVRFPDHPGIPHYLIHACDNQEMAPRGLAAARAYAAIAPSAPHALHMPSHIFTRLGLWDDSIASNLAARSAAHQQGDQGEELHAMDYLMYAYLQSGRDREAADIVRQTEALPNLAMGAFKIGYAATAIPVRYVVERRQWTEAEKVADPQNGAQPQVVAIAAWARGLGFAHDGQPERAMTEVEALRRMAESLKLSGNDYWATQVDIMRREVEAWSSQAASRPAEAVAVLRSAADDEDAIEKLPLTPGPIVPAREQLGQLLLEQKDMAAASRAFDTAAINTPGRRGVREGAAKAAQRR